MAGIRLTDGTGGCPPTQAPPADYENPFRFDSAGRLWITSCFKGFRYFGAARQDLFVSGTLGDATWVPAGAGLLVGAGIPGGEKTPLLITNSTECTMGVLLGLDLTADIEVRADNQAIWTLSSRWNGAHHSLCSLSNAKIAGSTALVRQALATSANPHDLGFEAGGTVAALQLAPGASATIGAQLFLHYAVGSPTGTETIHSSASAVRVYGYVLD